MSNILAIDIETYSEIDLRKAGVYPYARHESFEILLFGYAWDGGMVHVIDLASGEELPVEILEALENPKVLKTAFNANFERTCIAAYLKTPMPPEQWQCSSVHARYLGLPGSLDKVAKSLKLEQQKDSAGKRLIDFFSKPCKPTKTNGGRTRNPPEHDPEKWQQFIAYCQQDVEVERSIRDKLGAFPLPAKEQQIWVIDQQINDRGVRVDLDLVKKAIKEDGRFQKALLKEAKDLTGLSNPNSLTQLKGWLKEQTGQEIESLTKETVPQLIETTENKTVERVLEIRKELSKTSNKKYRAMQETVCPDGRIRGLFQFYGASTGRWAGRQVQVQNLPRNKLRDLDLARDLAKDSDYETIELLYGSFSDTLSQLIRTALIPEKGHRFVVADYSAIEARVIAWLAGEKWRLDVFKDHGKIYEASASAMFGVPIEQIHKGHPLRQKGKIAELALGYQGSVGALTTMGALKMGLTEEELPDLVSTWRTANPQIVQFWSDVETAALEAMAMPEGKLIVLQHRLKFYFRSGVLFIELPSGRALAYMRAKVDKDKHFNKPALKYQDSKGVWTTTYGGKLVENIVQAVARDCLAEALTRLAPSYNIVMHIHDEIIIEVPENDANRTLETACRVMGQPINWAPGLPLRADGFICNYYMKD